MQSAILAQKIKGGVALLAKQCKSRTSTALENGGDENVNNSFLFSCSVPWARPGIAECHEETWTPNPAELARSKRQRAVP